MKHNAKNFNQNSALDRREMYKSLWRPVMHPVQDYTAAVREHIDMMKPEELEAFGHDVFSGPEQMEAALDTIDKLAQYDRNTAWKAYLEFMDVNFSGMSIAFND